MGDVSGIPNTVGNSVLALGTRGFGGGEDGLEGRHAAVDHHIEESDRLGEESSARSSGHPERGLGLQFNRFLESSRREEGGEKIDSKYNGLKNIGNFVSRACDVSR